MLVPLKIAIQIIIFSPGFTWIYHLFLFKCKEKRKKRKEKKKKEHHMKRVIIVDTVC